MKEYVIKVVMYFNIIDYMKLYTTLRTWFMVQTSNYKQFQLRTHQRYDTSCLTLIMRIYWRPLVLEVIVMVDLNDQRYVK
jgi:hypothetical protein